jgi:small GTP-binding protein
MGDPASGGGGGGARQQQVRLALMGCAGVGKSSLLSALTLGEFSAAYDPTVEDEWRHELALEGATYTLEILDTGGDAEFCTVDFVQRHARDYEAFLLVYAVNDYQSFECLDQDFIHPIREGCNISTARAPPAVLVASKSDLSEGWGGDGGGEDGFVGESEGRELARRLGDVPFVAASAATGQGVREAFEEAARQALQLKIVKQGYLMKASGQSFASGQQAELQRRYVALTYDSLCYCEAPEAEPLGTLKMRDIRAVALAEEAAADGSAFSVQVERFVKRDKRAGPDPPACPARRPFFVVLLRMCCAAGVGTGGGVGASGGVG